MFNITDLIYRVPNFLTDSECQSLIDEYESRSNEHDLERSLNTNTGMLQTSSFKVISVNKNTPNYKLLFKKTEQAVNQYLDYLESFNSFHMPDIRSSSMLYSHAYRILKYDVGSKIHPHTDHDPFVYGSVTFNLNDGYTGGTFSFFNGKHNVKLKKGEMMIWPADYFWVHEVKPIKSGVRYCTNSFLQSLPRKTLDTALRAVHDHLRKNYSEIISLDSTIGPYNTRIFKPKFLEYL